MKKLYGLIFFSLSPLLLFAQNINLYHSGTQFDGFENPVQQSFKKDFSRKYAITLFPHLNAGLNFSGDGEAAFKRFLFTRSLSDSNIGNLGMEHTNQLSGNVNTYLFNYRIFKTRAYNRELGFSLQLRNEASAIITNETIALFDSYDNFQAGKVYQNAFNNSGENQAYWQLGLTYRENYNDKWGFGAKVSLLNGLTFNKVGIGTSQLTVNPNHTYTASLKGDYISSFAFDKLNFKKLVPNLKNMGAAISLAASYQMPSGYYFTLNLKDAGFIHWSKKTPHYQFDSEITVLNPDSANASAQFFNQLKAEAVSTETNKSVYTKIETKLEFAVSKEFGFYKPVFVASKSVFNPAGQFALVNNFKKNAFVFSLNSIYDLQSKFNLGSQIMVKSANMECYTGTEQIFPTYYFSKSYLTKNENIGKKNPRADFYIGINVKFGPKMQSIGAADEIPGLNDKETGYVVRLSKKERKKLQKQNKKIEKQRRKNDKRNHKR